LGRSSRPARSVFGFLLILSLAVVGLWFWFTEMAAEGSRSNLGASLCGGAVVGLAVLLAEDARERQSERESLRLTLSVQQNLEAVDLSRRDLSGFYLVDKKLHAATLHHATLRRANLERCELAGADMRHADLRDAQLIAATMLRVDLRYADLRGANLEGGSLRGRPGYPPATLNGALLHGADLRGANLAGVTMIEAYCDWDTTWPEGFDERAAGVTYRLQRNIPGITPE
jgi:uncharacterized protein YjbI with pentapeptide repeats